MNKFSLLFATLILVNQIKSQDFSKEMIQKNKIKKVHQYILNVDTAHFWANDTSFIISEYNRNGLLLKETKKASSIYPLNTLEVTDYIYQDSLLSKEVISKMLKNEIIKTDTIYYEYDSLERRTYQLETDNYSHRERLTKFEYVGNQKSISKQIHYWKDSIQRNYRCPFVYKNGMLFTLNYFEVFSNYGKPTNPQRRLEYNNCGNDTVSNKFCLYEQEIFLNMGDTIRQILLGGGLASNETNCDNVIYYPGQGISRLTIEKYQNNRITQRDVINYNTSEYQNSEEQGTVFFFYNSTGLLETTIKNGEQPFIEKKTIMSLK